MAQDVDLLLILTDLIHLMGLEVEVEVDLMDHLHIHHTHHIHMGHIHHLVTYLTIHQ